MALSTFDDKSNQPNAGELAEVLGRSSKLWNDPIRSYLAAETRGSLLKCDALILRHHTSARKGGPPQADPFYRRRSWLHCEATN